MGQVYRVREQLAAWRSIREHERLLRFESKNKDGGWDYLGWYIQQNRGILRRFLERGDQSSREQVLHST